MKFTQQLSNRSPWVYGLLFFLWVLVIGWQAVEHSRVKKAARSALISRSKDITATLGVVIRSQRRFGGIVSQERLESALNELVRSGELSSVALMNVAGDVVASAGLPVDFATRGAPAQSERWDAQSVTLVNLVDLGSSVSPEREGGRPTIVVPEREGPGPRRDRPEMSGRPSGPRPALNSPTNDSPHLMSTNRSGERSRAGRSFWMSEEEYQSLIQKRLHSFAIVMSTRSLQATSGQDLWVRLLVGSLAGVAVAGLALAWRNLVKSSDLQIRLLRASELNSRLKEMNLAAAGLAHETRNPLNIIRGLAQLIGKGESASPETRGKSREITEEVDRVTAQLNEFINYSRPREVRLAPVALKSIAGDVARALSCDLEDKQIELTVSDANLTVDADEQLLRQVLFNLVINAIQAVPAKGSIQITSRKNNGSGVYLEVSDNGPGVPPEQREEIFKPYFTTHQKGTGLGLAVVQQIILAHGWEIHYLPNEPTGAIFRLTGLKLSSRT
jgi:signal transduction histidine kinase